MTDPVTAAVGAAAAKSLVSAGDEMVKTTGGLITRLLGPSADRLGLVIADWSEFRLKNLLAIGELAERKSGGQAGLIPPRVAHRIIEEGSFTDDELMAEYLSGLLAGSRTPSGRDDRAVAWTELVTGLSSIQIRAHFLIYRELAFQLQGRTDLRLGLDAGRSAAAIEFPLKEFMVQLVADDEIDLGEAVVHSIPNLVRLGLIGQHFFWGASVDGPFSRTPHQIHLVVQPSISGMELYAWVLGLSGITPQEFPHNPTMITEVESAPPRIPGARLYADPINEAFGVMTSDTDLGPNPPD